MLGICSAYYIEYIKQATYVTLFHEVPVAFLLVIGGLRVHNLDIVDIYSSIRFNFHEQFACISLVCEYVNLTVAFTLSCDASYFVSFSILKHELCISIRILAICHEDICLFTNEQRNHVAIVESPTMLYVVPITRTCRSESLMVFRIESGTCQVEDVFLVVTWFFYLRSYGIKRFIFSDNVIRGIFLSTVFLLKPATYLVAFLGDSLIEVNAKFTDGSIFFHSLRTHRTTIRIQVCQREVWFLYEVNHIIDNHIV